MSKHTYFTGQPVLAQIIKLIPRRLVTQQARRHQADRYCKRFFSWDHLITMLFSTFCDCQSLREVTTGMLAAEGKLRHLGLQHTPRRSTLSDANERRPEAFFAALYHQLVAHYLPDSRTALGPRQQLYIVDSTTISLFSDVLANAGRPDRTGRRKGGVKAHTLIGSEHNQAEFVRLTAASRHDTPFLRELKLPPGSLVCFDKGYLDYKLFARWSDPARPDQAIGFVSRLRAGAAVELLQAYPVSAESRRAGVQADRKVWLGHTHHRQSVRFQGRLVDYYDADRDRTFCFVTNRFDLAPEQVAAVYRRRWQIEMLFKRIKMAYPLRYFLGESANAIKIQVWCAMIADLLIGLLQARTQHRWSYAGLRAMVRLHSLSYVDLHAFLEDPIRALLQRQTSLGPPDLFSGGLADR